MLKLKLQYFDYLMRRAVSLEKTLMLGKTRGLVKIIRDIRGTFHAKMGLIKDRNFW